MQRLAFEFPQCRNQLVASAARPLEPPAVDRITDDGMPRMREVQANLMRTAGLEPNGAQRMRAESLEHPIMRDRRAAVLADRHARSVAPVPADRYVDRAAAGRQAAADGAVLARHLACGELARQRGMRLQRARHDQQTAGVLVKAVHDPGARHRGERRVKSKQGVLQRVPRIAGSRVHDQAGRLIDDQAVAVLVDERQADCLGEDGRLRRRRDDPHADFRPRIDDIARLQAAAAGFDIACVDPSADAGARMFRQQARERAVQPQACHFLGYFKVNRLELRAHRVLEVNFGASGILPRSVGPDHCKESLVRPRDLERPARVLAIALLVAALGTGCRTHRGDEDAKSGPEVIYRHANKSMNSGDFATAVKQLQALEARFPFSEQAHQAEIDLIYAYYKDRQTDPAIDAADTFIRENPTNLRVDYAYYMKGLIYFSRQRNFLERYFKVDLSARPPLNSLKSFNAFAMLLQKFPHSPYAADARQRMIYLRNRLASFEMHVAEYYMRRGAYVGAIGRAKYCIEYYDGAPAEQQALQVLIEAYRRLGMADLAASAQRVYQANRADFAAEAVAARAAALAAKPKKHWHFWKIW